MPAQARANPRDFSGDPEGNLPDRQTSGFGFSRAARVHSKAEFERVFSQGRRSANPVLALHWLEDALPARLGLAVSRKVDARAVGRNRIKRVLRDGFRKLRPQLRPGAYVVVARTQAAQTDATALRAAFERGLHKLGALPQAAALGTMPPAATADSSPHANEQTSS